MESLVAALLGWIAVHSAYDVAGIAPPAVVAMTPREITAEYYAEAGLAVANRREIDPRILALYAFDEGPQGTIYIIDPALTEGVETVADPLDNPVFQERLLHELVHHVQWRTGAYRGFRCAAEGEVDAYRLGGAFLDSIAADDPLPNRRFWAAVYSRC